MSNWMESLVVGKQEVAPRVCFYGAHGIGKSTLASQFPAPIFIPTEDGLDALDVTSFPLVSSLDEVRSHIGTLATQQHDFKTAVLDSVDWLIEPLITADVESKHTEKEMSFGKGQMMVAEALREVLSGLDVLRKRRGMNIVLLAHASPVRYEDPRTEPYDRYQPKIPNRCNALLQEWVDVMAFAAFRVIIKKAEVGFNNTVTRGITTGERLLHFIETPAYVAKNRYNCPESITMAYDQLASIIPIKQ